MMFEGRIKYYVCQQVIIKKPISGLDWMLLFVVLRLMGLILERGCDQVPYYIIRAYSTNSIWNICEVRVGV